MRNTIVGSGILIKKYIDEDFAYTDAGQRLFGEEGPTTTADAQILNVKPFSKRMIIISNNHPDINVNYEVIPCQSEEGDLTADFGRITLDGEYTTIIDGVLGPNENITIYGNSHPEIDSPFPGVCLSLQRDSEPDETGHGIDVYFFGGN